jgi:hypothetical protein
MTYLILAWPTSIGSVTYGLITLRRRSILDFTVTRCPLSKLVPGRSVFRATFAYAEVELETHPPHSYTLGSDLVWMVDRNRGSRRWNRFASGGSARCGTSLRGS